MNTFVSLLGDELTSKDSLKHNDRFIMLLCLVRLQETQIVRSLFYMKATYRNFKKFCHGLSHVGLGNNAMLTAKSLKGIGIDCRVEGVDTPDHIATVLRTRDYKL